VGDADELEAMARAPVIVHTRRQGAPPPGRRDDPDLPALEPHSEAWPLLHLTLTQAGDTATCVQVVAESSALAGRVALNLAAIAARESRETLLVDAASTTGALVPLLPASAIVTERVTERATEHGAAANAAPLATDEWDATRRLPLGREASLRLVFPRRVRGATRSLRPLAARGAGPTTPPESGDLATAAWELAEVSATADLTVLVSDELSPPMLPPHADAVLCVRRGRTPLQWLADAARELRETDRRLRAVVVTDG
jgi:hypothetical protein